MKAPVAVFTYNRPDHTRKMLQHLNENNLVDETDLYIFSDFAKKENAKQQVEEVRREITEFKKVSKFNSTTIILAEANKGLAKSIITGVSELIDKYGAIIVLEDDLISSRMFLSYMNEALNYYKDNDKIWSISGYTFLMRALDKYDKDVFFTYRGCSWGWATWKDRWFTVDWQVEDYAKFRFSYSRRKQFNRGGSDLTYMLMDQMNHKIDSWAIRWCYAQSKQDMLTVYPTYSYIKNVGADGTGTHTQVENEETFLTTIDQARENPLFIEPIVLPAINDEFKSRYKLSTKSKIKRNMLLVINVVKQKLIGERV